MADDFAARLLASRRALGPAPACARSEDEAAEGGCGVIGMAASVPLAGRHLLQALAQMRNRGNGKGGGIAAVGLDPDFFGVPRAVLAEDYLLAVALLDPAAQAEVERDFIAPTYEVDHSTRLAALAGVAALPGLEVPPPLVQLYFVRVRPDVRERFVREQQIGPADLHRADDEIVYQTTYRLNRALYASTGEKRAFVLSHGKDLLILKMVGYGDDVVRWYRLEDLRAQVWIGHHRYPTKGRVWHPGGAHPFLGMHEALVHNGDFANYASIVTYLAQRAIHPLFLTDTEVAVLVFDLLHRVYGYPLEYVIEALAPTTERDFTQLPPAKQRVYRALQATHIHASPDGPWFFLIAQSTATAAGHAARLIGITDTSMLRPQVFALQRGEAAVGFAASERQAIDAALESLAAEDRRFWPRADLYWNARGGSHTDGGAFVFEAAIADGPGEGALTCTDKFGRRIEPHPAQHGPTSQWRPAGAVRPALTAGEVAGEPEEVFREIARRLPHWGYEELRRTLERLEEQVRKDTRRADVLRVLEFLVDRRVPTGGMKRSGIVTLAEAALTRVFAGVQEAPGDCWAWAGAAGELPAPRSPEQALVLDAAGFPPEGPNSAARALVAAVERGFRRIAVANTRGHRFLACGLGACPADAGRTALPAIDSSLARKLSRLGAESEGVRIDVYGSPGDYLASGIDGPEVVVHGAGQDQLAQIMKSGTLVVHGDVGQTFLYGAKGGAAFVLGNAAGRPLINAVGKIRAVVNGTCLDYLAESFMAGDPLAGGGFVVLNGVAFDEEGTLRELPSPYPGGNLFSLASGGAIYARDPRRRLTDDQLNGGAFAALAPEDWEAVRPLLEENERHFGIAVRTLLTADGEELPPDRVYRKIAPSGHKALTAEEAWVRTAH
jgi:glutamate synthase domain-containing protein 1/glutamate synthase domain-containing protein 3